MNDYHVTTVLEIVEAVQRKADNPAGFNGRFPLTLHIQCASKPSLIPEIEAKLNEENRSFTTENTLIRVWA